MIFSSEAKHSWIAKHPMLEEILQYTPVFWENPYYQPLSQFNSLEVSYDDMMEADALCQRFAPYLAKAFPETAAANGIIESPLREVPSMKAELNERFADEIKGALYLKCDNELPIAGSVKARGGVYEVLHYAEQLALEAGMITSDDSYEAFASQKIKNFFRNYSIGVGSTGNLGLSIGIMSAKLGFDVSVYMSADARQWKKDLLRSKGASVFEFSGDFSEAVKEGRRQTLSKNGYFVDDEKSKHLFLGYSVAAFRLKQQFTDAGVQIDEDHPLCVYLPCGVGGAPGGIAFGLRQVFGDAVHCFFTEPTHAPAVLLGLLTGEKEKVSVQNFGLDNITAADGLAVGRASSFASAVSEQCISGIYTVKDEEMFPLLTLLYDSERIFVEPSATPGLLGPGKLLQTGYLRSRQIDESQAVHLAWATGGALVPEEERTEFYNQGKAE